MIIDTENITELSQFNKIYSALESRKREIINNYSDEFLNSLIGKKFRATGYNLKFTCEILSYSRYEGGVFCTVNNSNEYGINQVNLYDLLYNYCVDLNNNIECE